MGRTNGKISPANAGIDMYQHRLSICLILKLEPRIRMLKKLPAPSFQEASRYQEVGACLVDRIKQRTPAIDIPLNNASRMNAFFAPFLLTHRLAMIGTNKRAIGRFR